MGVHGILVGAMVFVHCYEIILLGKDLCIPDEHALNKCISSNFKMQKLRTTRFISLSLVKPSNLIMFVIKHTLR